MHLKSVEPLPETLAPSAGALPAVLDQPVEIVIVGDHPALRKGLELLLCSHGHRVVGATHSPERALQLAATCRPDLALVDIEDDSTAATALARRMFSEHPGLGVVFYSARHDPELLAEALACGARGFALKAGAPEELVDAIATVAQGDSWLDPRLARPAASDDPLNQLSLREREILGLLADGLTGQEVAGRLFLSPETIRTHVRNAMRKLDARTRAQAIAMVVRGPA